MMMMTNDVDDVDECCMSHNSSGSDQQSNEGWRSQLGARSALVTVTLPSGVESLLGPRQGWEWRGKGKGARQPEERPAEHMMGSCPWHDYLQRGEGWMGSATRRGVVAWLREERPIPLPPPLPSPRLGSPPNRPSQAAKKTKKLNSVGVLSEARLIAFEFVCEWPSVTWATFPFFYLKYKWIHEWIKFGTQQTDCEHGIIQSISAKYTYLIQFWCELIGPSPF